MFAICSARVSREESFSSRKLGDAIRRRVCNYYVHKTDVTLFICLVVAGRWLAETDHTPRYQGDHDAIMCSTECSVALSLSPYSKEHINAPLPSHTITALSVNYFIWSLEQKGRIYSLLLFGAVGGNRFYCKQLFSQTLWHVSVKTCFLIGLFVVNVLTIVLGYWLTLWTGESLHIIKKSPVHIPLRPINVDKDQLI